MTHLKRALSLAPLLVLLSACASQPESIHYYLLSNPDHLSDLNKPQAKQKVVLQSLELAEYLQSRHIVMQLSTNKLQFSNKHRWAENLHVSVEKALLNSLNQQSQDILYLNRKQLGDGTAQHLFVELKHFLITENSTAVVSGNFWVKGESKDLNIHSFNIKRDLSRDGYPHAIEQLTTALSELATRIRLVLEQNEA
ncbi:PqiC family protein [Pseudoteredinibacter isoporae]|uniref:PqiC family protein n=1 Tax=Pseudoteredinibacter isoporae TaxID=570281 RepID=UPI0031045896